MQNGVFRTFGVGLHNLGQLVDINSKSGKNSILHTIYVQTESFDFVPLRKSVFHVKLITHFNGYQ